MNNSESRSIDFEDAVNKIRSGLLKIQELVSTGRLKVHKLNAIGVPKLFTPQPVRTLKPRY